MNQGKWMSASECRVLEGLEVGLAVVAGDLGLMRTCDRETMRRI